MEETLFFSGQQMTKVAKLFWLEPSGKVHEELLDRDKTLGRRSSTTNPDIDIPYKIVSRNHGELRQTQSGWAYIDVGSSNGTWINGNLLGKNGQNASLLQDGDVLKIKTFDNKNLQNQILMVYSTNYQENAHWNQIALNPRMAEIAVGRENPSGIALQNQMISRHHASFFLADRGWAIIDHNSKNGVFINGRRISQPIYLAAGDVIQIANHLFFFMGNSLIYQDDGNGRAQFDQGQQRAKRESLSIAIEERNVWSRFKKKTLLQNINLEINSSEMVLILGGSGAGKTTFMNAVMGYEKAEGKIVYGNTDIYAQYQQMKYEIGFVPQMDLLRSNDTVYDTLYNAAQMKLRAGTRREEYAKRVDEVMNLLGLERERDSLVVKLSGGQRKRLSIAVEFIAKPSLFFLDEPDSGLDGIMARGLMENLRDIADTGKIVMVITHGPDRAADLFNKVIVLAKSTRDNCGHLAFYGSVQEAYQFFETDKLEGVVKKINRPDEGGEGKSDYFIDKYNSITRR